MWVLKHSYKCKYEFYLFVDILFVIQRLRSSSECKASKCVKMKEEWIDRIRKEMIVTIWDKIAGNFWTYWGKKRKVLE